MIHSTAPIPYERGILYTTGDVYAASFNGVAENLTQDGELNTHIQLSPNQEWIAFHSNANGFFDLYIMRPDGSDRQNITQYQDRNRLYATAWVAWSPDGERLAYVSTYEDGTPKLYTIRRDGTERFYMGQYPHINYDLSIAWSPDSQWITFPETQGQHMLLQIIRFDGTQKQTLSQNVGNILHPDWSPDGEWIVFSAFEFAFVNVYKVRADGSTTKQNLTTSNSGDIYPRWSPDGQHILFTSDRVDMVNDVFRMNADGTNVINLTQTPNLYEWNPMWSQQGDYIVFGQGICLWCGHSIQTMLSNGQRQRTVIEYDGSLWGQVQFDWGVVRALKWRGEWALLVASGLVLVAGWWIQQATST